MLSYLIERVRGAKTLDKVVLATSVDSSDDPVAEFCKREGIECFRGSLDDVMDRYYQAAKALKADVIVRLTGDCPMMDPAVIDLIVKAFKDGQYDYAANTAPPPGTFPDGMDVEVFSFKAFDQAWREAKKPSDREHVTFYFWNNPQIFKTFRYDRADDLSAIRLTVDYPADFEVAVKVFTALYPKNPLFSMDDILKFLNAHPEVSQENASILRNQGWQTAFEKDRQAGFKV